MRLSTFNNDRFKYVLLNSVASLLNDFYEKNDKILRINKVNFRNIPKDINKAIKLFSTFPDNTLRVAHGWFKSRLSIDNETSFEEIIKYFLYQEFTNIKPSKEISKKYCTQILMHSKMSPQTFDRNA
jgi:hypothetical protein